MKIALSVSKDEKDKREKSPYFRALVAAGARAEEIELVTAEDVARVRGRHFDGVLLAGGEDVDPTLYGEQKKYKTVRVNRARDDFEFGLLDSARDQGLPVFGICRGLQVINTKFGGTLYQDLEEQKGLRHRQRAGRSQPTHNVTLTDPESRLAGAFRGTLRVNSMHHQAIKAVGRGLKVTANSEDGLAEAVESADGHPFLLAVQWHPEELIDHPEQQAMLKQFVVRCRERAAQRTAGTTA